MKKLFTLAAAVLASFSLWAADFEPTAVYTVGDATTLGAQWKTGQNNPENFYVVEDTVIFSPYILYQSAATGWQEWTGCAGSGSTGTSWNAQGVFKGSAVWFTSSAKAATTRSTRQYFYNVTNCTAVQILVKSGSSSVIQLAAYEIVEGIPSETAVQSATYNTGSNGILEIANLDAGKTYRIVVNSDKDSNSTYYEIAFVKGADKEVKSTLVELTAVAINGEALEASQVATLLENKKLELGAEYVTAPTVTFTATTTVTYVDDTQKITDQNIDVVAEEVEGKWQAQTIINVNTYTVTAVKPASYTVNYYDGEILLGTEIVAAGGEAVLYLELQDQPLRQFIGWYTDKEMTTPVAELGGWTINADKNYYGKWETAYASSLNIEQLVLDNGTKYDIKAELTKLGYAYENIDALDTLNDLENKANRNYPYLGLKLKKADAYVSCNLKAGDSIAVLFGNIGEGGVKIGVNGQYETLPQSTGTSIGRRAQTNEYLEIICPSTKTIVIKQIMINEDIKEVVLPAPSAYLITCAEAENGKVEATWENKKYRTPVGALVTLTATPDEGYKVADVKVNGVSLNAVEGVYSFTMPAEDVTVTATFEANEPQTETYLVTITAPENGTIEANWEGKGEDNKAAAGTLITLTVTPAEGYEINDVTVNGVSLNGVYTFEMPAEAVTITATFKEIEGQGIDNTNVEGKAVKVIENGVLYLKYKGTMYDVQGHVIR